MTPQKRQTLPSAVDAERAILGTMLRGQRAQIDHVQESIPLDAWYRPDHALLCRLLFRLADSGHDCTLTGAMDAILASNRTDGDPWSVYGGLEYVMSLPDCGGIVFYEGAIRSVVETWIRRQAIAAIDAARDHLIAFTPGDDPARPIASLRVDLDKAEAGLPSTAVEFMPFVEAVEGAISQAEAAARGERSALIGPSTASVYPSLAPHLPIIPSGELTFIAGRPGTGKSAVARALAEAAAIEAEDDGAVFVWSLEMTPEAIARRSLATMAREGASGQGGPLAVYGMTGQDIAAGVLDSRQWEHVNRARDRLNQLPIWIAKRSDFTIDDLIQSMTRAVRFAASLDRAPRLMVIDYLQLLGIPIGFGRNESSAIGEAVRRLKVFAASHRVAIVVLSQLNRQAGDNPKDLPRANQLYKSGDIEAHAAVVWLLHRPWAVDKTWPDPTEAAFVLDKVRGGSPGTVQMTWCGPSEAYLDPANANQL